MTCLPVEMRDGCEQAAKYFSLSLHPFVLLMCNRFTPGRRPGTKQALWRAT
jgi:hypothetical protein